MLGRRLLLLVAVLLVTGAIAAALTPRDLRNPTPATTATTPPSTPGATGGTGAASREVTRTIDAAAAEPAVVRGRVGDLLHLEVRVPGPEEVEIVGTGRFASGDATTPARFEFFLEQTGKFPIRLQNSGREAGRLDVSAS